MEIIKRDGRIVEYNRENIYNAIARAYIEVYGETELKKDKKFILGTTIRVEERIKNINKITVEQIQDLVETELMGFDTEVAKAYIKYRYKRSLVRESNTTDKSIKELIEGSNEYWNTENSNKNPKVANVQRDYVAGITSTDITERFLLPKDIVEAHKNGILHFHDADYFLQKITNCCLINLEDMLQNGTVINGVKIEKPHRLLTATTIATQIITAVASSQYGGTTISLTALAPFVRDSYERYREKYKKRGFSEEHIEIYAREDLLKEVEDSVQTFNYQINSMQTSNGQAPFISVFMYLGENPEYTEETEILIHEFLKQRIVGLKNECGVYVTQAFPKLLYVLEEQNCSEDKPYWWLTELAAKCTAKRLVPDYISEKKMKELKVDDNGNGQCYPCINKTCA